MRGPVLTLILAASLLVGTSCARAVDVPPPTVDNTKSSGPLQTAVLAGGCFWGVQGVYEHVKGVKRVLSGYSGGERSTAQYQTVGTGKTGHAESVEIVYDPERISFGEILQVFFSVVADPTELNRQGPDVGNEYRSVIFYKDDTQKNIATQYIAQLDKAGVFHAPIVTRVDPLKGFYTAEGYHQDFLQHNPDNPYIMVNDLPKIRDLQREFPALYNSKPVTAD